MTSLSLSAEPRAFRLDFAFLSLLPFLVKAVEEEVEVETEEPETIRTPHISRLAFRNARRRQKDESPHIRIRGVAGT